MLTLSHGIKIPQAGDVGQPVFDALAANDQLLNDHSHNGVNSPKIGVSSLSKVTQNILATDWANPVNGIYSQNVILAGGLQFDTTSISFRDSLTGEQMYLGYVRLNATTYTVFCNDSTRAIVAIYV